jgi:hypothetical protein
MTRDDLAGDGMACDSVARDDWSGDSIYSDGVTNDTVDCAGRACVTWPLKCCWW